MILLVILVACNNNNSNDKDSNSKLLILGSTTSKSLVTVYSIVGEYKLYSGTYGIYSSKEDLAIVTDTVFIERTLVLPFSKKNEEYYVNGNKIIHKNADIFLYCPSFISAPNDINHGCNGSYWTRAERITTK